MTIDWPNFTPMAAATGGIILGLAAAALALCNGRIAGISGIVGGLLRPVSGDSAWRVAFIVGLLVAPLAFRAIAPRLHFADVIRARRHRQRALRAGVALARRVLDGGDGGD